MIILKEPLYQYIKFEYKEKGLEGRTYYLKEKIYCPVCGEKLYSHGTCGRHVRWSQLNQDEIWYLVVVECNNCNSTHRLIPESIIPGKLCLAEEFVARFYYENRAGKEYYQSTKWVMDLLENIGEKLTRKEVREKYTEEELCRRIKEIIAMKNYAISS